MVDTEIINKVLGKELDEILAFDLLSGVHSGIPNTLTYCNNEFYLLEAIKNPNITGILCNNILSKNFLNEKYFIESENPGYDFILLHNYFHKSNSKLIKSSIHTKANIHPTAFVSEFGVFIEDEVTIGPYVVVHSGVTIKSNTIIGAHSVLGCEDIEAKKSDKGFINAFHDGCLEIGNSCFVGSGVIIAKGVYGKTTVIGNNTFISNNSIIAHGVTIGENCMILGCHICGSVTIGNNVRINPKALISNGLTIGDNVTILLGSVVITNIQSGKTVSGYFAIEHPRFLYKFIKLFGKI
jgi:UDP-3-O-[3-hydroxymyristoyl] glucosamine N-acyltransferase